MAFFGPKMEDSIERASIQAAESCCMNGQQIFEIFSFEDEKI